MKKFRFFTLLICIVGSAVFTFGQVTIYEERDFSGKSASFGIGTYAANFGPIKTIGNDTASSIVIEQGFRVRICQHEGNDNQGAGNCEEYSAGRYNLRYDNQASWIKVWKDGNSNSNDSVDLGQVITDAWKNRKKPKQSDTNNNSNSDNGPCVFKETFTIASGKNSYIKDYPISLGSGAYRIEYSQNLNREKMFPGFRIGLFNKQTDPKGERLTTAISGGSYTYSVQGSSREIAYWSDEPTEKEFRAGEFIVSKNLTNTSYNTLQISFFQGAAAGNGATGSYEIRIIGSKCGGSSTTNTNDRKNSETTPVPAPYDPKNQTEVKLYLLELGKGNLGCGDKLTAVPFSITKQPSILRATLEELFRYPEIQRGYSNSTAGMSLENLSITGGTANIYVRGSLGGDCDSPRFIAQLTSTAKQFSSVKNVRIFLNGREFTGSSN